MTIDFNNQEYNTTGTGYAIQALSGANIILKNANITSDRRVAVATGNATITIESGTYNAGDCAICAGAGSAAGNVIINGGTFNAQEVCALGFNEGSTITINDGVFTSTDNFVVGGNGSAGQGGTIITINGGEFNGNITSNGYIACGIYHPNEGTLIVNGGKFNVTNGVGILVRGGDVTINDVEITTTGEAQGKVGDSRILTSCSAIYVDGVSSYPGWTNCHTTIKGGIFNSDVDAVTVTVPEGEDKADRLTIEGGIFNGETDITF